MSSRKRDYDDVPSEVLVGKVESIDDLLALIRALPRPPPSKKRASSSRRSSSTRESGLRRLIRPLEKLHNLVGMKETKDAILSQLLLVIQGLHDAGSMPYHSVITGPPGVGKTQLIHILAEIYCSVGLVGTSNVVVARRSDLIGKYLGHTAAKTQEVIDDSRDAVLLLDECYSLGDREGRDSFSKECLDTLNQALLDNPKFICIIAGYEKALEECFFAANEGLARRFSFRFSIPGYSPSEMKEILSRIVSRNNWSWEHEPDTSFFEKNKDSFPFFGGDMESLFTHIKLAHAKHLMTQEDKSAARKLSSKDLEEGLRTFLLSRNKSDDKKHPGLLSMYL